MTIEKAIEVLKHECYVFNPLNFDRMTLINTALDTVIEALEKRHDEENDDIVSKGHWIKHDNGKYHWYLCSRCDTMAGSDEKMMAFKYCPNCGAKMVEDGVRIRKKVRDEGWKK